MKRAGFTLIEILVASAVGLLVLTAAYSLYAVSVKGVDKAESSFGLEQNITKVVDILQQDLRYTTLPSVAVYNSDGTQNSVGLSFLAAAPLDSLGKVELSRFGTPNWQKHVFYALQPIDGSQGESRLLRYEIALDPNNFQLVSTHHPFELPSEGGTERIVAKKILQPGWSYATGTGGEVSLKQDAGSGSGGGFQVKFLQQDGSLTDTRPSQNEPENITGILEATVTVFETSDLGKLSILPFTFRVAPRN
jgi:prepilin-type N-terminal cleavage/methylation domain-containing protein